MENEEKYQALQNVQELRNQRSKCVHSFLSIRESMLQSCLDEPEILPSSAPNEETSSIMQERGLVTPQRVVKFSMSNPSLKSVASFGDEDATASLGNVVDFEAGFEFSSVGGTIACESDSAEVCIETSSWSSVNNLSVLISDYHCFFNRILIDPRQRQQ